MLTTFFKVSGVVLFHVAEKLMKATARMANENALAIEAERPSAPGKNEAGMVNIPNAIAVSPIVLSQSTHFIVSEPDFVMIDFV